MVNWAELPDEIIHEVAKRLRSVRDFVRFGSVCQSWRSVAATSKPLFGPCLILSEKEPQDDFEEQDFVLKTFFNISLEEDEMIVPKWFFQEEQIPPRGFFDISTKRVTELKLPEAHARRCWGSPHGWIFTIGLDLNIHLLNPLTRQKIPLPSQTNFVGHDYGNRDPTDIRQYFIEKFALSSHPTHPSCVVMVVYSNYHHRLAFTTPGDKSWTPVKTSSDGYDDIIFFNHLFYLVDSEGNINLCDTSKPDPEDVRFMPPPPQVSLLLKERCGATAAYIRFYLVDVCGDLCFVVRVLFGEDPNAPLDQYRVVSRIFQVYKLDFSTKSWIELGSLPNYALFVGTNISFAISTLDQPQLKSNSIYFTDDYVDCFREDGCDIGVFDLEEKKVSDPFYSGKDISSKFCPPFFLTPDPILR